MARRAARHPRFGGPCASRRILQVVSKGKTETRPDRTRPNRLEETKITESFVFESTV
jgi:hypothetical protein